MFDTEESSLKKITNTDAISSLNFKTVISIIYFFFFLFVFFFFFIINYTIRHTSLEIEQIVYIQVIL